MARGGARPGAGRKPGGVNRITQEAIEAARSEGVMPLDYLLTIMRNEAEEVGRRIDCAKAAAQYLHPKLNAVDLNANVEAKVIAEVVFRGLND